MPASCLAVDDACQCAPDAPKIATFAPVALASGAQVVSASSAARRPLRAASQAIKTAQLPRLASEEFRQDNAVEKSENQSQVCP